MKTNIEEYNGEKGVKLTNKNSLSEILNLKNSLSEKLNLINSLSEKLNGLFAWQNSIKNVTNELVRPLKEFEQSIKCNAILNFPFLPNQAQEQAEEQPQEQEQEQEQPQAQNSPAVWFFSTNQTQKQQELIKQQNETIQELKQELSDVKEMCKQIFSRIQTNPQNRQERKEILNTYIKGRNTIKQVEEYQNIFYIKQPTPAQINEIANKMKVYLQASYTTFKTDLQNLFSDNPQRNKTFQFKNKQNCLSFVDFLINNDFLERDIYAKLSKQRFNIIPMNNPAQQKNNAVSKHGKISRDQFKIESILKECLFTGTAKN